MLQKTCVETRISAERTKEKGPPVYPPSSPPQHFSAGDHSTHPKLFLAQKAQPERDLAGSPQLPSLRLLSSLAARASKSQ